MFESFPFWKLLLIPLAGWAIYTKGNSRSKIPKGVCLLIFGMSIATAAGLYETFRIAPWLAAIPTAPWIIVMLAFAIGGSFAPGNAVGPALSRSAPSINDAEWWQKGILLKNCWAALAGLGFVRSMLTLALIPLGQTLLAVGLIAASTLAAPAAVWIAQKAFGGPIYNGYQGDQLKAETERSGKMWRWQDYTYGGLVSWAAIGISTL